MTKHTREVLERALGLPRKARAEIAHRLIESLDEAPADDPAEVERAWSNEIERRIRDVVEGRVKPIPFDEGIARVRKALARDRAARKKKR